MKEINDIIDRIRNRKEEYESSLRDVLCQQTDLTNRRIKVESRINELDYMIEYMESEE